MAEGNWLAESSDPAIILEIAYENALNHQEKSFVAGAGLFET